MQAPTDFADLAPDGAKALQALDAAIAASGLEPSLTALVGLRAAQIGGAPAAILQRMREAAAKGESKLRLHRLDGWRGSRLFTPRERAALAWTEALSDGDRARAPEADLALRTSAFDARERAWLALLIGTLQCRALVETALSSRHPGARAVKARAKPPPLVRGLWL